MRAGGMGRRGAGRIATGDERQGGNERRREMHEGGGERERRSGATVDGKGESWGRGGENTQATDTPVFINRNSI